MLLVGFCCRVRGDPCVFIAASHGPTLPVCSVCSDGRIPGPAGSAPCSFNQPAMSSLFFMPPACGVFHWVLGHWWTTGFRFMHHWSVAAAMPRAHSESRPPPWQRDCSELQAMTTAHGAPAGWTTFWLYIGQQGYVCRFHWKAPDPCGQAALPRHANVGTPGMAESSHCGMLHRGPCWSW